MKDRILNPFGILICGIAVASVVLLWLKWENRKLAKELAIDSENESEIIESPSSSAISEPSGVVVQPMASETFSSQIPENETADERLQRFKREGVFDKIIAERFALYARPRVSKEENLLFQLERDEWWDEHFGEFHEPDGDDFNFSQDQLDEYRKMSPRGQALEDIGTLLFNRQSTREKKLRDHLRTTMTEAEYGEWFDENHSTSFETHEEEMLRMALNEAQNMTGGELYHPISALHSLENHGEMNRRRWQEVADFLRKERESSQAVLDGESQNAFGNDADWHAERLDWLDETSQRIGIDLDAKDEIWLDTLMADLTEAAREAERVESNRRGIPSYSQVERIHEALMSQDESEVNRVLENVGQIIAIEQLSDPNPPAE